MQIGPENCLTVKTGIRIQYFSLKDFKTLVGKRDIDCFETFLAIERNKIAVIMVIYLSKRLE